ncbi:DDB1- and CUL4-associated factor 15 [Ischnura elegans]|uniref:DDB1- and CUL4-associated factor 15 n=1 Tax=Ischnura elegans TaxID=197161 RepID=UPI001ED893CA|nr:DDB1- and CUL4-associated factor 15 [Ischnura elegans]
MEVCDSPKRKTINCNKKRKSHLLQKLYQREIQGSYGPFVRAANQPLFSRLPHRLAFNLGEVVPESALIAGHVFMGLSRCGQFLMSYTHTVEPDNSFDMVYRYRLHWWTFVPSQRSRKVAEVTLFSDAGVGHNVFISISQWPTDTKHVLIYGCSDDPLERSLNQSAHCYLTITTVPSMHNCPDCLKVAASYEDEDLAASWDSCVRFSCLRHGLTVHTTFDVVPPFPKFEPRISMRHEGTVVINTGNFLHALHVRMENVPGGKSVGGGPQTSNWNGGASHKTETETEAMPAEGQEDDEETEEEEDPWVLEGEKGGICKRPAGRAASQPVRTTCPRPCLTAPLRIKECPEGDEGKVRCRSGSNRRTRLGEMMRRWCRPDEVEVEWACWGSWDGHEESNSEEGAMGHRPPVKRGFVEVWGCGEETELGGRREVSDLADARRELSITCGDTPASPVTFLSYPSTGDESVGGGVRSRRMAAERAYEFTDESDSWGGGACEKLSVFRRRRLADKKYEFCDDEDAENVVPFWVMRGSSARGELSGGRGGGRAPSPASPCSAASPTPPPSVAATASPPHAHLPPVQELAGSGGGETASQVVLRPLNRNTSAAVTNVHHVREAAGLGAGDRKPAPQAVVRVGLLACGTPVPTSTSPAPVQAPIQSHCQSGIASSTGCSVQYKRWYLEVDDELISVITDIEDDDLSSSTGYHSALPLDVHGSGYAQMQMVSSAKVEKLRAPSVLVHQMTLDVEQFCHEVAQKLCADAGKKYWFCNDYDVEIVAVCPISGDVIAVAAMLIQAAVKTKGLAKSQRYPVSSVQRSKYQTSVRFVWNLDSGRYQVVDADELREVIETEASGGTARGNEAADRSDVDFWNEMWSGAYNGGSEGMKANSEGPRWHPARTDSLQLRRLIPPPLSQHGVRTLSNQSELRGISLKKIVDVDNMVALVFDDYA